MQLYIPAVNRWKIFDNYTASPELIAHGRVKKIGDIGVKMESITKPRPKQSPLISDVDTRVQEALNKAAREAKRRAVMENLPLVSSRKKNWPVPK